MTRGLDLRTFQNWSPPVPYKILGITAINHAQYGPGQQATIQAPSGKKWRTQLPGKYLAQLSKEDIAFIVKDIIDKKNVFLVFREKMIDNSYWIDISDNDSWVENFKSGSIVAELETSIDEGTTGTDGAEKTTGEGDDETGDGDA
ncbi:hypothetical protein ONE63_011561 [Megalurothrips usitatus]|uniref:Uncharacterized protein n=1 Tax=Megalurothrips usitatus TaxID=439358 RepID=A0AAV7WZ03_9NEOP|nr:hypothetical protein ONE63_011561 [Megalurothrips usitatus]